MVCPPPHSPSARQLARPPRDALAALSRACGHGNACWQHPGRRVHANVQVEVLCAHNGTQHQPKHKNTPQALEQPISGSFPRARTRRDPCYHGSPIVHARLAPHKPLLPSIAQLCIMSANMCAGCRTLLHLATTPSRKRAVCDAGGAVAVVLAMLAHGGEAQVRPALVLTPNLNPRASPKPMPNHAQHKLPMPAWPNAHCPVPAWPNEHCPHGPKHLARTHCLRCPMQCPIARCPMPNANPSP